MTFWEISWQIIERYFRNVSEGERERGERETERDRETETERNRDRHFKVLVKSHGDGDKFY